MQKRKKIITAICVAAVFVFVICLGAVMHIWRQPQTRLALLLQDGMSENGLLQKTLSMREAQECLAQTSGKLQMEIPILGTTTLEFETQLDEEGMRFRFTGQPEKVYLYDYTDERKHGIVVGLLGEQVTERIDYWLSVIAGDTKVAEGEGWQHTGNKKEQRRPAKEMFSDMEIREAQKQRFFVEGELEELDGYTIVLSEEQCQSLLDYFMDLTDETQKGLYEPPVFHDMIGDDIMQLTFYYKGSHLGAVQLSDGEETRFSLQETKDGFPQMTIAALELADDTSLSMEICYLPKEYADTYNDVTLDIGSFSLPQLSELFGLW